MNTPSRLGAPRQSRSAPPQRGSTLLEVLVSVLIFSFGILGMVGLQARATQYSLDADDRNRAALFADDLAAQIRLSRTVNLGADKIAAWDKRVKGIDLTTDEPTGQGLPQAETDYDYDETNNTAVISITWRHPRQAEGAESRLSVTVALTEDEVGS